MRTIFSSLALMPALAGPAMAHAGDHTGFSLEGLVAHFMSQPDHAAGLALALVVLVAAGVWLWRSKRT